ncbi:MAG: cupin domain-containing protein [Pseudomonadota bacterium]
MPKVRVEELPTFDGPDAAAPYAGPLGPYIGRAISKSMGLKHLGANVETLKPGSASSHRHWHDLTDELVVVLTGELVLVEDDGETSLRAGDIAVFPAGAENGHCLRNRSNADAMFLVVGTRDPKDRCYYADIDLVLHPDGTLTRRDGSEPLAEGEG